MPKTKVPRRTISSLRRPIRHPKVKSLAHLYHMGTDIEAFYAAQEESARASRDYVARRRQR